MVLVRRAVLVAVFATLFGCSDGPRFTPASDAGAADVDSGDTARVGLFLNEVSASSVPDWFEIYNGTGETVDLAAYTFTDDLLDPAKARFAEGTTVAPGEYFTVEFDPTWPGFGLGGDEELALFDAAGLAVDSVDWMEGDSPPGGSYGRIPDQVGPFKALSRPTAGLPNVDNPQGAVCGDGVKAGDEECDDGNRSSDDACSLWCTELVVAVCGDDVREGDEECDGADVAAGLVCDGACMLVPETSEVVINEILAQPAADASDWIELANLGASEVDLSGWVLTDSDPSHTFVFGPATALDAGGYLVIERGSEGLEFGFGSADAAVLYDADGTLRDRTRWTDGDAPAGSSWGRSPDGTGDFGTLGTPSPGTANP